MHTLAFLLAVAPQAVRIHRNTVKSIEPIRGAAQAINAVITDAWSGVAAYKWVAAFRGAVIEETPPGRKRPPLKYVVPSSTAEANVKDQETIAVLNKWWEGVPFNPSKLPMPVVRILAANIWKGKLWLFLQKYSQHFTVHEGIGGQACLNSLPHPEHVAHNSSSNDLLSLWCSPPQGFVPTATSTLESANIQGLGGGV